MFSKERLELVGKATALAALLFTVFSYANNLKNQRDLARYQASIKLMERYRTDGVREAETTLGQRLLYYRADGLDPNDPATYPDRYFAALAKDILFGDTGIPDQPGTPLLPQLYLITDFFGEVGFCLTSEICNSEILKSYFCPRATEFRIRNRRLLEFYTGYSASEDWTNELETLLDRCA